MGTHAGMIVAVGSFVGFFTFVTPLLIHWITKKYVTSLEYDPDRDMYSATTLSFFLREKKVRMKKKVLLAYTRLNAEPTL